MWPKECRIFCFLKGLNLDIIKQCTHPHSPPSTPRPPLTSPTPTHPKYFAIHLQPPKIMPHHPPFTLTYHHPPKIMPHPPKITYTHSKQCLTNRHLHKIWSNKPHLLKLLFDHEVKQGRHIIKVNSSFHGHIYTFTKRMGVC